MSKKTKKRTKAYRGPDAATGPKVTRYSVGDETAFKAWWKDNKRVASMRAILIGLALLVSWIIYLILY